jgi:uncharacterized protein YcfJ
VESDVDVACRLRQGRGGPAADLAQVAQRPAGALIGGVVADTLGAGEAIAVVAALTVASAALVAATAWSVEERLSAGR